MAKNKNVECDAPVIHYKADPDSFRTIVLKVHKKLQSEGDIYTESAPLSAGERDAMVMSKEFPQEAFITVYCNGVPTTMSVSDLIGDTLISIINKGAQD